MKILSLASDYDSSLAFKGKVSDAALEAIRRLKSTGRKFLLVTGRRMDDLLTVFPDIGVCDLVVGENGALLYWPATGEKKLLAQRPSSEFVGELKRMGVTPMVPGDIVLATLASQKEKVNAVIRQMGVAWHGILNKESLMVLPGEVDKSFGMLAGLKALGLGPESCAAVGDAENDECMLLDAGVGIAVANAIPSVKAIADVVTQNDHGFGVVEIIERILESDFQDVERRSRSRRP